MRPFVIAALLLGVAAPALGQDAAELDDRLDLVERQLRAVQREVFPGGNPQFFEPEIQPAAPGQPPPGGSTGPIVDLTERVSALEARLADITNSVEQNEYRIGQIEARLAAMEAAAAPMLGVEDNRIDPPITGEELGDEPPADPPRMDEEAADPVPLPDGAPIGPAGADPDLPSDAGEASYVRGYRLWRDRDYPAAQEQLRATIEEFPGHRFESYARNLLGRAYLDEGKPANAVEIFVDNYRDLPNGERAADSLFYLGVALTQLNYADRACLAFQELREVFGDGLRSDISEQLPAARRAASCE